MRDERRPGLDGPGRMVKSRGLDGKISYLTKIWGFAKGLSKSVFLGQKVYSYLLLENSFPGSGVKLKACRENASVLAN